MKPFYFKDDEGTLSKPRKKREYEYDFSILDDKGYQYYYNYVRQFMFKQFMHIDEDLIQNAVLEICKVHHEYDPSKSKKETYMCFILKNTVLMKYNKENKYKHHSLQDKVTAGSDERKTYEDIIAVDNEEYTEDYNVYKILEVIKTDKDLYLLKSRVVDQLSYDELCIKYDKPDHWVKNNLHTQRNLLKKMIKFNKIEKY